MELKIKTTNVFTRNYNAYLDKSIRFIINQGGSRSSKTWSICQFIVWYALMNHNKTISIVRKTGPALCASVLLDFLNICIELDIHKNIIHHRGNNSFRFPNGTMVRFFSVDQPAKVRGRKHDIVFMNEANQFTFEDFQQLNMRTADKIFLDFNPSDIYSWIYDLLKQDNSLKIHSTFRDNPFLEKSLVQEIENLIRVDQTYYEIYALGIIPSGRERVFPTIHRTDFPEDLDYVYGADWGYVDPTVLVKVGTRDGKIFIKEALFESYLTTEQLVEKMKYLRISTGHPIYADSARPDIIATLNAAGFYVLKADKKINEGLDFLKSHEIHIDPTSENTLKEFTGYSFKKVKDVLTDRPVDYFNHSIDAARYAGMSLKNEFDISFAWSKS